MEDRQETIRGESAKKQALLAVAVVDELAAYSPVHPTRGLAKIVDFEIGPIFAETVRQHTVSRGLATEIYYGLSNCVDRTNCLNAYLFSCRILYLHLDGTIRMFCIKLQDANKVRFASQAIERNRKLAAGAQFIIERRFRGVMLRVCTR